MSIRFDKKKLAAAAQQKGLSPAEVLRRAGVSRNAYYNLLRKDSLLPKSVSQIAEALGIDPDELVEIDNSEEAKLKRKMLFVDHLAKEIPNLDVGTAMTTLKLLERSPLERLEMSISYGNAAARI